MGARADTQNGVPKLIDRTVAGDDDKTTPRSRRDTGRRMRPLVDKILAPVLVAALIGAGGFALGTTRALGERMPRNEAAEAHASHSDRMDRAEERLRVLENGFAAQTAILKRIERAVGAAPEE